MGGYVSESLCVKLVVSQFWFLFGGDFHGVSVFDVGDSGVDGRVCGAAVGKEGAVVEGKGIARSTMMRWRRAFLYGDLAEGIVPRDTGDMSDVDGARFERLKARLAAREKDFERERAELRKKIERLERHNAVLERSADALGKAIGLLGEARDRHEPTGDQGSPTD